MCSILGNRNSPTFDDLQKMTLVRGCVKEILRCQSIIINSNWCSIFFDYYRLQPTTPLIPRVIEEETETCGYQIPAKVYEHCTAFCNSAQSFRLLWYTARMLHVETQSTLKIRPPSNQNAGQGTVPPMKRWMHLSHYLLDLVHVVAMVMFIKRALIISIHNFISLGGRLVELE